jgi:hypothetical protein
MDRGKKPSYQSYVSSTVTMAAKTAVTDAVAAGEATAAAQTLAPTIPVIPESMQPVDPAAAAEDDVSAQVEVVPKRKFLTYHYFC